MIKKTNNDLIKKLKAFSFIEIAVVILVIGILIIGISTGMDLYDEYQLTTARNLTINSRVPRISNLELWLETTNTKSFSEFNSSVTPNRYDYIKDIKDGKSIAKWNNLANNYAIIEDISATQTNSSLQPTYIRSAINGIPALYFDGKTDGTGDYLTFNSKFINNKIDVTMFIVEQRTAFGVAVSPYSVYQYIICGSDSNFNFGWNNTNPARMRSITTSYDRPAKLNTPFIHVFQMGDDHGSSMFLNGSRMNYTTNKSTITSPSILYIAYFNRSWTQNWYTGLISEIIIYSKSLSNSERNDVEKYLSQKYKIRLE